MLRNVRNFRKLTTVANEEVLARLKHLKGGNVNLDIKGSSAFVRFNHPESKNSLSGSMMAEFYRIVNDELSKFDGKAVILTGQPSGGAFCAGSDVNCLVEFSSPEDGIKMSEFMHDLTSKIYFNEKFLTVSHLNGYAMGGGAELATCTDIRLPTSKGLLMRNQQFRTFFQS